MSPAEFSRETGLSSKALRLYEGRRLLVLLSLIHATAIGGTGETSWWSQRGSLCCEKPELVSLTSAGSWTTPRPM